METVFCARMIAAIVLVTRRMSGGLVVRSGACIDLE